MRNRWLLPLAACWLVACAAGAHAAARQNSDISFNLERGALRLRRGESRVISNMRLRLRFADGSTVTGDFEAAGRAGEGADDAGRYALWRYGFKPAAAPQGPRAPDFRAALELRRYASSGVVVAWLDYEGPPLAPADGALLLMGLDSFARGMAQKRLKLYWTAPVFVSDHRLLAPANQLLLWRQTKGEGYHLIVPLAGSGMVGEVGVGEINYRPEFRVAASSRDPRFSPRRVPLFAYASAADPYRLTRAAYETAFAATAQRGRLRWQKAYPEVFRDFGWCSWNAYGHAVSEEKILGSVRGFRDKRIPLGFVLVDDGWLSVKDDRLTGFGADPSKFPRGLEALARALKGEHGVRRVGVWHTFQGYWSGVEADSEVGRAHPLFRGQDNKSLPDPRDGRGESFYADWYARLKGWGYDFVKVDGQANNIRFTDGLMPLFDSGGGSQRNLEGAARRHFADGGGGNRPAALGVINCMEMTLENVFNWRESNVARNSDDYQPEVEQNYMDHVYQNAYNAFWLSNFAYPDWDMFQSHDARAEFHAAARAASGGPVYVTDESGRERAEVLLPLVFSDGRLPMADEPGQVTRDLLLTDPALEPVALKVFGRVTREGLRAGFVAAFNVNKSAPLVGGAVRAADVEGMQAAAGGVAVYRRGTGRAVLLRAGEQLPFSLGEGAHDFFTLVPAESGFAPFGLLDKYLGPAALVSVSRGRGFAEVRLREGGDFGAWLERAPARVELDGRPLPASAYAYSGGLLRVPAQSFGARGGERTLRIRLAAGRR